MAVGVVALRAGLSSNARGVGRANSAVGLSATGSITSGVHTLVSALELVQASGSGARRSGATSVGAVFDCASDVDSASRVGRASRAISLDTIVAEALGLNAAGRAGTSVLTSRWWGAHLGLALSVGAVSHVAVVSIDAAVGVLGAGGAVVLSAIFTFTGGNGAGLRAEIKVIAGLLGALELLAAFSGAVSNSAVSAGVAEGVVRAGRAFLPLAVDTLALQVGASILAAGLGADALLVGEDAVGVVGLRAVGALKAVGVGRAGHTVSLGAAGTIASGGRAGLLADAGVARGRGASRGLASGRGTVADGANVTGGEAARVGRASVTVRLGAVAASAGCFNTLGVAQELILASRSGAGPSSAFTAEGAVLNSASGNSSAVRVRGARDAVGLDTIVTVASLSLAAFQTQASVLAGGWGRAIVDLAAAVVRAVGDRANEGLHAGGVVSTLGAI